MVVGDILFIMIVVVGNGTSAIGKGLGTHIDASERVVRFNHFRLEGYRKDLGTKVTDHVHIQGIRRPWPGAKPWAVASPKDHAYLVGDSKINNRDIVPRELLEAVIIEARLGNGFHASTGLIGIYLAMEWGKDVRITNFDFAKTGHYWDKSHQHSPNHNWAAEARYVQSLLAAGHIACLD